VKTILQDQRTILPVSVPLHGYHGHHAVSLSVPSIVGRRGVIQSLEIKLSWDEKQKLAKSVQTVKQYL
jgi:L-lactate dehydrogenase